MSLFLLTPVTHIPHHTLTTHTAHTTQLTQHTSQSGIVASVKQPAVARRAPVVEVRVASRLEAELAEVDAAVSAAHAVALVPRLLDGGIAALGAELAALQRQHTSLSMYVYSLYQTRRVSREPAHINQLGAPCTHQLGAPS